MEFLQRLAAPAGRTGLAAIFLASGLNKITAYEATAAYMNGAGVPGWLLPAVIAFEILAPLAVLTGFYARAAALSLAGFSMLTAFLFHFDFADQIQSIMFLKNVAIAGGFLMIVSNGPGAFSVSQARGR